MQNESFLAAIAQDPDDTAVRLIYADWLEEQGGAEQTARAAFIRAQCRLAELPEDDPARGALEDEAADRLAEYEDEWTQPLHEIAGDWRFERGFVERITIGAEAWLTHAQRLIEVAPLRSLHLLASPQDIPHLAASSPLQRIEALDFSGCHLNDRALQQLLTSPYLERLTALNLHGNDINTPGLRALVQSPLFPSLRRLDLGRNLAIGDNAARLLAHANAGNHLQVLNLERTNLTLDGVMALFESVSLPHLSDLNVRGARMSYNQALLSSARLKDCPVAAQLHRLDMSDVPLLTVWFTSLPLSALRSLSLRSVIGQSVDGAFVTHLPLANLTALDLAHNNLGAAGVQALVASPNFASLRHLNISHNNIRDAGANALAGSPHLTGLHVLDVSGNGIGGPGLKALAASANCDALRHLSVGGNFIGVVSVHVITESAHLRNLTWLDLSDAFLEADSARALASSAHLSGLRTLRLQKNLLGDEGARVLARSPHLAGLRTLDLNDNRIGKSGAEALARAAWRRMRSLELRGNVFTDTQENLLRQRFGAAVLL